MSTPIFLGKFEYLRGICPDVILILPSFIAAAGSTKYEEVSADAFAHSNDAIDNSFIKSLDHLRWRYSSESKANNVILKISDKNDSVAGFVVLKKIHKKGLPFYALLDIVSLGGAESLIAGAVKYASRKLSLGLLVLDREDLSHHWANFTHRRVKDRFNFLVKGRDEEETASLSRTKFNFTFGDLDFI
jgi:hypothetical protein